MKWTLVDAEPAVICGAERGRRSKTRCELPPDHIVGRKHTPIHEDYHTGRSPTGRWFSWPQEVA